MKFFTNTIKRRNIAFTACLIGVLAPAYADAALTYEQIQRYKNQVSIPQWKHSTRQVKDVRASPPDESSAEAWKSLDAETHPLSGKAPLTKAISPRDGSELLQYATWLRWKILSENADGRFSYAYAFNLSRMGSKEGDYFREAAIFFFHAKLALEIDGARCLDSASADSIVLGYETQKHMQPLIERISKMSKKEKAIVMQEAIFIEELRGERPAFGWLCTRGSRAISEALRKGRQFEAQKPIEGESEKQLGKTFTIDVSNIEPAFIPEEQWRKARIEKLDRITRSTLEAF